MSDDTIEVKSHFTDTQLKLAESRLMKSVVGPISGMKLSDIRRMNEAGKKLRDQALKDLPLLKSACYAYVELAATREFAVSGKPSAVPRTLDLLNNATIWDVTNGNITRGFEAVQRRRVLDHVTLGRSAFAIRNQDSKENITYEYIDPTLLYWQKNSTMFGGFNESRDNYGRVMPIKPDELVYSYGASFIPGDYRHKEIILNYPFPFGMNNYMSPVMLVYPTAVLAWLLLDHNTASLDGRRLRDIIIVNKGLFKAVSDAIKIAHAIHVGEDPSRTGLPIVEASVQLAAGVKLSDQIATLGLSKIPEAFNPKDFEFSYANEIAASLGLALRQFYNNEQTTNRALEEVQEARQQNKGPQAYIRSEERLINSSPLMRIHASGSKPCHFGFVEETDISSLKATADAMKAQSEAAKNMTESIGAQIRPEVLLTWWQEQGLLPGDISIDEMLMTPEEMMAQAQQKLKIQQASQVTQGQDPANDPTNVAQKPNQPKPATSDVAKAYDPEEDLDYGEITMTGNYKTIARRHRIFSLSDVTMYTKIYNQEFKVANNELFRYDASKVIDDDGLPEALRDQGSLSEAGLLGESSGHGGEVVLVLE